MAQKQIVQLIDDIDGSEAVNTHTLTFDGVSVTIDLNEAHSDELRDTLAPYLDKGRRASASRAGSRSTSAPRRSSDAGKVREWARENGFDVSERGRISAEIREAYAGRS